MNATLSSSNGVPCIKTTLTINDGGFSRHRSVASASFFINTKWSCLMGALAGQTVEVSIFSPTNFCGKTSTEQLTSCIAAARKSWDKVYADELGGHEADFIERFGDGKLSFSLTLHDIVESYADMKKLCDELLGASGQ
jgi:hypothetical protein